MPKKHSKAFLIIFRLQAMLNNETKKVPKLRKSFC